MSIRFLRYLNRRKFGNRQRKVFGIYKKRKIVHRDLPETMYIRVKRMKSTYFVQCNPRETVLDVKQKLVALTEQPVKNQRLILMSNQQILKDLKSLDNQKVENDAVVALTLKKDDNQFEDVNIAQPPAYQSVERILVVS